MKFRLKVNPVRIYGATLMQPSASRGIRRHRMTNDHRLNESVVAKAE